VTTNAGVLDFVVPSGGTGSGTITNMLSSDSSIVWTDSEGPQPDGSVTSYVEGVAAGYVATNAADYTGLLTNTIAFHGESNVSMRVDSTNVYFGAPALATKATLTIVSNAAIAADAVLRSELTNTITVSSNAAVAADLVVSNAYTNTAALAAAALPKAGGTMSGDIDGGANDATNFANIDALDTRIGVLEVPYQTYSATVSPDAGGTCTIAYANGSLVKIDVSANITIFFDNAAYPTNGVNRVGVEVWAATNTVGFVDSNVTNVSELVFTNKYPASLFFRKTGTNNIWWGRD